MTKLRFVIFLLSFFVSLFFSSPAHTQNPVTLQAKDTPNDKGESITLTVEGLSQDTTIGEYEIWRATEQDENFQLVAKVSPKQTNFVDTDVKDGIKYLYLLKYKKGNEVLVSPVTGPVISRGQWFHTQRVNVLIGALASFLIILGFVRYAQKGKKLYIRPISGLQAIDDAIGRATEMGKPILYSAGLGKMDRVATMASLNILSSVAEKTAEYNTPLIFPNYDPVVMTTAQEVVKEACSRAGHPDAYHPDNIFFVTQSQFGYAAAVDGIMTRQLPATNLFLGTFEAEALILAETGNSIGALQIAGTDSTIQLSFFIVACDYTLIGE